MSATAVPEDGGGDRIVGPGVEEDGEVVGGPRVLIQVQLHLHPLQRCVHWQHLRDWVLWVQDLNDRHVDASRVGLQMKYVSKDSFQSKVFVYVGISVFVCIGILDFFSIMPLKFSSGEEKFIFYPCVQLLKYLVCRKTLLTINLRLLCPHLKREIIPSPCPAQKCSATCIPDKKGVSKRLQTTKNSECTPRDAGTLGLCLRCAVDVQHIVQCSCIGLGAWKPVYICHIFWKLQSSALFVWVFCFQCW